MKRIVFLCVALSLALFLAACSVPPVVEPEVESVSSDSTTTTESGMGAGGNMMARHHATVPKEYAGLTNPVPADDESLTRGEERYVALCATCHGDGGLGDGPGGTALDPAPSNIAHTSQMMGDAYMFWRISEGGINFETAMPAWGDTLDEQTQWDLINYMRALGSGQATPKGNVGGAAFDPDVQAAQEAEMLAEGIAQGIITEEEATVFEAAHIVVDARMAEHRGTGMASGMDEMMADVLVELVTSGELTQEQADTFLSVHDRLGEAGLMQ